MEEVVVATTEEGAMVMLEVVEALAKGEEEKEIEAEKESEAEKETTEEEALLLMCQRRSQV